MTANLLDQLTDRILKAPAKERAAIEAQARAIKRAKAWIPNPGPQTEAYLSEADIIHYGGQAGGGKTQLLLHQSHHTVPRDQRHVAGSPTTGAGEHAATGDTAFSRLDIHAYGYRFDDLGAA